MTFPVPILPGRRYRGLSQTLLMGERTRTGIVVAHIDRTAATAAIVKMFSVFDPKALDLHNSSQGPC